MGGWCVCLTVVFCHFVTVRRNTERVSVWSAHKRHNSKRVNKTMITEPSYVQVSLLDLVFRTAVDASATWTGTCDLNDTVRQTVGAVHPGFMKRRRRRGDSGTAGGTFELLILKCVLLFRRLIQGPSFFEWKSAALLSAPDWHTCFCTRRP